VKTSSKSTPMEVDNQQIAPPSPLSTPGDPSSNLPSPLKKIHRAISKRIKDNVKLVSLNSKDLWPQALLINGNPSEFIEVNVMMLGDKQPSLASLRRTLKKFNLRSINPKDGNIWNTAFKEIHDFRINIPRKNLKNNLSNMSRNWTPLEKAMLYGFHVEVPGEGISYVLHI